MIECLMPLFFMEFQLMFITEIYVIWKTHHQLSIPIPAIVAFGAGLVEHVLVSRGVGG